MKHCIYEYVATTTVYFRSVLLTVLELDRHAQSQDHGRLRFVYVNLLVSFRAAEVFWELSEISITQFLDPPPPLRYHFLSVPRAFMLYLRSR